MCDNLCRIIRDYFQSFGKGFQIIRRAEFLEEVRYVPGLISPIKINVPCHVHVCDLNFWINFQTWKAGQLTNDPSRMTAVELPYISRSDL